MNKRKKVISLGLATVLAFGSMACGGEENAPKEPFVPQIVGTYEAEDAVHAGNVKVVTSGKTGYSGTGYAEGFIDDGTDTCTFKVEVAQEGFYDLNFVSASSGGNKDNFVSVDGESAGIISVSTKEFSDSVLHRIYLPAGAHDITVSKSWGWIQLDRLDIITSEPIDPAIYEVTCELSNENASENAKKVYAYLCEIYGEKILSGQYCDDGIYGKEIQVIKKVTGKVPAVLGLDLMNYSPTNVKNGTTGKSIEHAKFYWENGGIVTFCWHWTVPEKYLTGTWYSSFYKEHTNINLSKIMNGEDAEGYDLLMKDIDAIAKELKVLQEADVPVLFRPLHEASGGWFWWGASGAEAYKKLYIAMYDKLTNEYGLNNLIWVWNGQDAEWYPGDEYVDIIGEDLYPGEKVYSSQAASYLNAATNYSGETKLVYMTENGCVFDPELAKRDGAMWGMWCTWVGEFVAKDTTIYALSETYTEEHMLIKAYSDEDVLTLDELPDWK